MLMVSLRNIKLFDLKTSIKSRDASDASGARRLGIRKLMLGLIIFNISFTVYAQDNNLEKKVIFIKEEKLLENNLATKRIFYKKCPGLTNFNCFRNILVFNNKFINLDDFTINKNDFEQSVLYEIKEGEILVLNLNFLTRGNSFWQKYFGINEIKDVKYKIKKEKKIDSTLKYIEYQFKISEILSSYFTSVFGYYFN